MSNTRPIPHKITNSKFINNTDIKLKDKLFQIINNSAQNISYLDFLIGYFQISGFKHLNDIIKNKLDQIEEIRILVGINLDPIIAELVDKNIDFTTAKKERFIKQFAKEQVDQLNHDKNYSQDTDLSIYQLLEAIKSEKIKMRIIREKGVHAKFYVMSCKPQLVTKANGEQNYDYQGSVIVGSSNLSHNGLVKHYEFNAELRDSQDIETALYEFNQLWEKSVEVSLGDIEVIEQESYLSTLSPQELYYKMLIEYFGMDRIERDKGIESLFPEGYKALEYQIYAIKDGLNKLEKYNGFFLSDVVGLGKTLIATIIAQKLEVSGRLGGKILVTCPPALKASWEDHFDKVGINRHTTIKTHDMLHEITDPQNYGMVIIDESHRFKSKASQRYEQLYRICKEETKYIKKVILLSATPQNNSPQDLANQIYFFTDPRNSRIGKLRNLEEFFKKIQKEYKTIKDKLKELSEKKDTATNKKQKEELKEQLREISNRMRDEVLKYIMIRRTRNDVKALYKDDLDSQGIAFPDTPAPTPLEYELKDKVRDLTEETLKLLKIEPNTIGKYGYYRYLIYPNLTPEGQEAYQERMGTKKNGEFYEQTAERLTGLMKSLMFKRFESSIYSFKQTLKRQIASLEKLIGMMEIKKIFIPMKNLSNLDAYYEALESDNEYGIDEEFYEQYKDKLMNLAYSDFEPDYLDKLKSDLTVLRILLEKWEEINEDSKLEKLVEQVKIQLKRKIQGDTPKVIIFTEAQTTAHYLKNQLRELLPQYGLLQVDSDNRKDYQDKIKENFDANLSQEQWKHDIQILISTDTLSEGVNMHRADTLINYDAPWNATILMQRAGRINRVGTQHNSIFVYNFQPSNIGEETLKFGKQVYQKLQSFHFTLGEDNAVYTPEEEAGTQGLYQSSKNKGEEIDPEVEFLADILELYRNNPKEFHRIKSLPNKVRSSMIGENESFFYFKQSVQEIHPNRTLEFLGEYFYQVYTQGCARKVERVDFCQMAQHLKAHLASTPMPLSKDLHYTDADLVWRVHDEEVKNPQRNTNHLDKKEVNEAKFYIQHNVLLTLEEKNCLIQALERGVYIDSSIRKQIIAGKIDLNELANELKEKMRIENSKSKVTIRYAKPSLQLSYTTKKG
ncbi:helicase-related protein [Helicobacter kayseriensis]|uniref:helicase-related protein n=1 Tax=Helicobacter kayseriensis TaxID=2905877 RepID=UPI001E5BDB79|nr:helicase-related protein [Helicobacter kayseriensis]MCE3046606.1 phospholipase D-like domain-containing protein [Helicobacter kayseriensis]MCE3048092.1 phospholipase D-like domain-containing protein [Helicobacter kayseriensis]